MRFALIAVLVLGLAAGGWWLYDAQEEPAEEAKHTALEIQTATLENGLEIVVIPNRRIPAVSHILWVKAGSIDEPKGASGVAHYLEHLLFKGTPSVPAGEYSKTIVSLGGNHNAFTGHDFTGYYVNIAKEHLQKVMELEADRLANVAPSDVDYEKERNVILEERKTRVDSNPSALFGERMAAQLFVHHPYGTPIIGWREEMEQLDKTKAMDYLAHHYVPENMVLVIAGDTDLQEVLPLAQAAYGQMQGEASERILLSEPESLGDKRFTMAHPLVRQPQFLRIIAAPSLVYGETQDALPLMLLAEWLGSDRSSYLTRELVVKQKKALSVSVRYSGLRLGPGTISISAIPADGVSLAELETAIDDTLLKLKNTQLTEENFAPFKTQLIASAIFSRDSLEGMAHIVGYMRMLGLEDDYVTNWPEYIEGIRLQDVQRVQSYLFRETGRITGNLTPEAEGGSS